MKSALSCLMIVGLLAAGCSASAPTPSATPVPPPSSPASPSETPTPSVTPSETSPTRQASTPSVPAKTSTPSAPVEPKPIGGWKTANLPLGDGAIALAVQVEGSLTEGANAFATRVVSTLNDKRGWAGMGKSFHLVGDPSEATIIVHLATPATVDARCAPLETEGYVSCSVGANVWLNINRWREAVPHIKDLETYRTYVISHEVGHSLGRGHVNCPGPGKPAPVMQQQTYGLQGCVANGWITVA